MNKKIYVGAKELSNMFDVSTGYAYKLIREMNTELKKQGYMTISGKVPSRYLRDKWFGLNDEDLSGFGVANG